MLCRGTSEGGQSKAVARMAFTAKCPNIISTGKMRYYGMGVYLCRWCESRCPCGSATALLPKRVSLLMQPSRQS